MPRHHHPVTARRDGLATAQPAAIADQAGGERCASQGLHRSGGARIRESEKRSIGSGAGVRGADPARQATSRPATSWCPGAGERVDRGRRRERCRAWKPGVRHVTLSAQARVDAWSRLWPRLEDDLTTVDQADPEHRRHVRRAEEHFRRG